MRIGFVTIWFERGQSYITRTLRHCCLLAGAEPFIFARTGGVYGAPKLETSGDWDVPNLTTWPGYEIPTNVLCDWIKANRLDWVVFNEEHDFNLIRAAKSHAKVATYLDFYTHAWARRMQVFDAVVCSSHRAHDMVKDVCPAHYVGWGVDTDLFKPPEVREDGPLTFFHNAGWLGINFRKNTDVVFAAFLDANLGEDAKLLVHTQIDLAQFLPGDLMRAIKGCPQIEIVTQTIPAPGLYHRGDVLVMPSKMEGLGLPLLEGFACGLPAIVSDMAPLNEHPPWVAYRVPVSGFAFRGDGLAFPEATVLPGDLARELEGTAAEAIMGKSQAQKDAREYAETNLSLSGLAGKLRPIWEG